MDLQSRASAIYDTYMGPSAKFKINVSDKVGEQIAKQIADGALATAATEPRLAEGEVQSAVTNACFLKAQSEIEFFLENDVFPRYVTWLESQAATAPALAIARCATNSSLTDVNRLGDRDKMREAMEELLEIPGEVILLRQIAVKVDAEENIDFYLVRRSTLPSTSKSAKLSRCRSALAGHRRSHHRRSRARFAVGQGVQTSLHRTRPARSRPPAL